MHTVLYIPNPLVPAVRLAVNLFVDKLTALAEGERASGCEVEAADTERVAQGLAEIVIALTDAAGRK